MTLTSEDITRVCRLVDEIAGIQSGRFAQQMIAAGAYHAGSRFFFAVGDAEETDDRDEHPARENQDGSP